MDILSSYCLVCYSLNNRWCVCVCEREKESVCVGGEGGGGVIVLPSLPVPLKCFMKCHMLVKCLMP